MTESNLVLICTVALGVAIAYWVTKHSGWLDFLERKDEPVTDKEDRAVSAGADLAGRQAETKARAYLAFQDELNEMRRGRWEQ